MSGILGIFRLDGAPVQEADLEKMLQKLKHRGPDGLHRWQSGPVGLGHCMLHTTPESLFEQLPSQRDGCVITAHARIDNREELYEKVPAAQLQPLDTLSDSDLILLAYQYWGEACLQHLLGDFAFAIWDAPKQSLFCGRDHIGVRPFYYYKTEKLFVFASEVKAILALEEVPFEINDVRIGDYLTINLQDKASTSYQNIWRLPPASHMRVAGKNAFRIEQYWELQSRPIVDDGNSIDYPAELRKHFTQAVDCRLRTAVPIGSHLSGGLDSSSICCVARDLLAEKHQQPLNTFSNVCDSIPESNEREFIEAILACGEFQPHFVTESELQGPLSKWQEMFSQLEEPLIGNAYLMWELSRSARNADVRILLNGYDGDTVISHGIMRLSEMAFQGQWSQLIAQSKALEQNLQQAGYTARYFIQQHSQKPLEQLAQARCWWKIVPAIWQLGEYLEQPRWKLWLRYLVKPLPPRILRSLARRLLVGRRSRHIQPTGTGGNLKLNPDFVKRSGLADRRSVGKKKPFSTESNFHCEQLCSGGFGFVLESMDQISAMFQTETRYPFLDKRLLELCVAIPTEQKLDQGWTRFVMRRAMENVLPLEIQWRRHKSTPEALFRSGLKNYDLSMLRSAVDEHSSLLNPYLEGPRGPWEQLQLWLDGDISSLSPKAWNAMTLLMWLIAIEPLLRSQTGAVGEYKIDTLAS